MGKRLVETVMGAVVLVIAGVFLIFAYLSSDLQPVKGYQLTASFASVGALTSGSDVRIGGVKVGSVTEQSIDPKTYRARVTFTIQKNLRLPTDSVASVTSDGLLGGKYLRIRPGIAKSYYKAGSILKKTEDALALEELLAKAIFLLTEDPKGSPK